MLKTVQKFSVPNTTQIKRDTRAKQKPDLSKAQVIYKVAKNSPADKLGLLPGDCLLALNNIPVSTTITNVLLSIRLGANYLFYQPQSNAFLEVETDCMPLGLSMLPNSSAIVASYKTQGYYGNEGFFALWEREDYTNLKMAAALAAKKPQAVNFLQRLMRASRVLPALEIMHSICDFEMGLDKAGLILLLSELDVDTFSPDMQAIFYFYKARQAHEEQDIALYQELMLAAYKFHPKSERIRRGAIYAGLDIYAQESMLSRVMPLHYEFEYLIGGNGGVSMQAVLDDMPAHKTMPVCFMPNSRGGDAYNEALKVFRSMYPYHKDSLHQMLVITNAQKNRNDPTSWYEQEEVILSSGMPLTVLLETTGNFIKDLSLRNAPTLWAIDKTGRVVWDKGLADDFDYWEML